MQKPKKHIYNMFTSKRLAKNVGPSFSKRHLTCIFTSKRHRWLTHKHTLITKSRRGEWEGAHARLNIYFP